MYQASATRSYSPKTKANSCYTSWGINSVPHFCFLERFAVKFNNFFQALGRVYQKGKIFAPTLFLIYISDPLTLLLTFSLYAYADASKSVLSFIQTNSSREQNKSLSSVLKPHQCIIRCNIKGYATTQYIT